jgi:hypothetical protein
MKKHLQVKQKLLFLFAFLLVAPGYSQITQKIVNGGTNGRLGTFPQFGKVSAVSGNWMVVGSPGYDYRDTGTVYSGDCGGASVYEYTGGSWVYRQRLEPTVGGADSLRGSDVYGCSVAIDGDYIVVGAYDHDYDTSGGYIFTAGAAWVFVRSGATWVRQQKLFASGTNGRTVSDYFGNSVAISGNTIAIGAWNHENDANGVTPVAGAGAVFVYTRTASIWSLQQKLVGTGINSRDIDGNFGKAISISGNYIAVGAPKHDYDAAGANPFTDAGAVFVFFRSGSTWGLQQKVVGTGTNGRAGSDQFGTSVAMSDSILVVGSPNHGFDASGAGFIAAAGAAYVYTRTGTSWTLQQTLVGSGTNGRVTIDEFGTSVDVYADAIVVGVPKSNYDENGANFLADAGLVYLFIRAGGTWTLVQRISGTGTNGRVGSDFFGSSVNVWQRIVTFGASDQDYDAVGATFKTNAGAVFAGLIPCFWQGTVSNDWNNAANWYNAQVPATGGIFIFQ